MVKYKIFLISYWLLEFVIKNYGIDSTKRYDFQYLTLYFDILNCVWMVEVDIHIPNLINDAVENLKYIQEIIPW